MCGIAGFVEIRPDGREPEEELAAMLDALAHRGPDGHGTWFERDSGVYLGHRRLSIVELSDLGRQPMTSPSGQLLISYNGEIYNHREIRGELGQHGHRFRGGSDTEVLLTAIEQWGLEGAINRCVGMFAFAMWDRARKTLHLCRDRLGKKPLYFGWVGHRFVFASELRAMRRLASFDNELDFESLRLYLSYSCVPGSRTAYRELYKLPPGCMLSVSLEQLQTSVDRAAPMGLSRPYWSVESAIESGRSRRSDVADESVLSDLEGLLRDAVRIRMQADVPLGAFLSGGVDSSLVVALMQSQAATPVHTFSIGYENRAYDEALAAEAVAKHLGTSHTSLRVDPRDALDAVRLMPTVFDEPFADASQIPTYLVSRLARRYVTVAVSGDGGDEVFAGYTRHLWAPYLWRKITPVPALLRHLSGRALRALSPGQWDTIFRIVGPLLPPRLRQRRPGESLHKFADVISAHSFTQVYERLTQTWPLSSELSRAVCGPGVALPTTTRGDLSETEQLQYWDLLTYLPDDILVKVDRATMAVSLEARAPLLDHRVVEFAWSLPVRFKIRDGVTKWALRQILGRYVPAEHIDRPKSGFAVPLDQWLRTDLRDWAEELLSVSSINATGFLRHEPIRKAWSEHLSGRRNLQYLIWPVLMLQGWLEDQRQVRRDVSHQRGRLRGTCASHLA